MSVSVSNPYPGELVIQAPQSQIDGIIASCRKDGIVVNCGCGGHGEAFADRQVVNFKPTPMPVIELDYTEIANQTKPDAERIVTNGGGLPDIPIDWAGLAAGR